MFNLALAVIKFHGLNRVKLDNIFNENENLFDTGRKQIFVVTIPEKDCKLL